MSSEVLVCVRFLFVCFVFPAVVRVVSILGWASEGILEGPCVSVNY